MNSPDLFALAETARTTDMRADWQRLWQALAGTSLVMPLNGVAGETIKPVLDDQTGAVLAYPDLETMAEGLPAPADYAQMNGAQLAEMLAPEFLSLRIPGPERDIVAPADALTWIAATYRAPVDATDLSGVAVKRPADPDPALLQAIGDSVDALGAACKEAWLIVLDDGHDGTEETTLVVALSPDAAKAEAEIAPAMTRAIQAMTNVPIALACTAVGTPLLDAARACGIGISAGGAPGQIRQA